MTGIVSDCTMSASRPRRWPLAERAAGIAAASRALGAQSGGVILMGEAGVGKTTLARAVLPRVGEALRWTTGTATAQTIPMGAFAHLLDIVDTSDASAAMRLARANLLRQRTSPDLPPLLVVDDAHLLDQLSATLLHQLALARSARFVVTVRTDAPAPDAVTALWKDGLLRRVDVEPLSRSAVAEVMESVFGGAVEQYSVDQMHDISQGNPLYLRHLVEGAVAGGKFQQVLGVWQLRGPMVVNRELSALVGAKIEDLSPAERRVVELVAFGEPLDLATLGKLAGADDIESVERRGLVAICARGGATIVRLAHPVYGAVVRDHAPLMAVRRRRGELFRVMSDHGADRPNTRLHLATLGLGSDACPGPQLLLDAGRDALSLGDLQLAETLVRGAYDGGGGVAAASLLSYCLAWQGRGEEAEHLLSGMDSAAMAEPDLLTWGLPRAVNSFWVLKDPAKAYTVLTELRKRLTSLHTLDCVDGVDAALSVHLGHPGAGLVLANRVLAHDAAPPQAAAWAASGAALAVAQMGRYCDLPAYVERGVDSMRGPEVAMLRYALGYAQAVGLPMRGEVDEAVRVGRSDAERAHRQQPGSALGAAVLGKALLASGRVGEAADVLCQSTAALQRAGMTSWEFLAALELCGALAVLGRVDGATQALARVERCFGPDLAAFEGDWLLARSWVSAAQGDVRDAKLLAREAADAAAAVGFHTTEGMALIALLRYGDATVARRLARLSAALPDGQVLRVGVEHAAALAQGDGKGLEAVAAAYERAGLRAVAADAYAQAAVAHEGTSRTRHAAAAANATKLAEDCGGLRTPALAEMRTPRQLTTREREIANLIGQGLTNKQIAERLVLSVRTVEGHIYRACVKINAPDRDALADVLPGGASRS